MVLEIPMTKVLVYGGKTGWIGGLMYDMCKEKGESRQIADKCRSDMHGKNPALTQNRTGKTVKLVFLHRAFSSSNIYSLQALKLLTPMCALKIVKMWPASWTK